MKFLVTRRFHLLIFFFSLLVLTRFYIDADLGWHIAIGRAFLEGQGIIRNDQFSWTMAGHYWGNSYFLYQIVVAWLFYHAGYLATVFVFGFVAVVSVLLLLPTKLNKWSSAVVLIGVVMASVNLGIKPHVFDFLFFALLLVLLNRGYYTGKLWAPFWFVFFLLWANFHVGFLVGLLTFSAFMVIGVLKARSLGKTVAVLDSILLLAASWLGTLATPFNIQMYKSIFVDSASPLTWLYVYEWQPIISSLSFIVLYLISGLVFIYILRSRYKELGVEWFLLACVLFMLPFVSLFYVLFWSAIFIFLGTRYFVVGKKYFKNTWMKLPVYLTFSVLLLGICLNFGRQFAMSKSLSQRLVVDGYPVNAMRFMVSHGYIDRVFNNFNWGGFIDWQYPQVRAFIDGRMNGWKTEGGRYIFDDFIQIGRGRCELINQYKPGIALLVSKSINSCFGSWQVVYRDETAVVLKKPNN
jgi:hypothetical protein